MTIMMMTMTTMTMTMTMMMIDEYDQLGAASESSFSLFISLIYLVVFYAGRVLADNAFAVGILLALIGNCSQVMSMIVHKGFLNGCQ